MTDINEPAKPPEDGAASVPNIESNGTQALTQANFGWTDEDAGDADDAIAYTITGVTNGNIQTRASDSSTDWTDLAKDGTASITNAQLAGGLVRLMHDGSVSDKMVITYSVADVEGTTTIEVGVVALDGSAAGRQPLRGTAGQDDTFTIDADESVADQADTITGFEKRDTIQIGDGSGTGTVTLITGGSAQNTYTLLYEGDLTSFAHRSENHSDKRDKVLAVIEGYDVLADGNVLGNDDVTGASSVIILDYHGEGGSNGKQTMSGKAGVTDVFSTDRGQTNKDGADVFQNFERDVDKIRLDTNGGNQVLLRRDGDDIVGYRTDGDRGPNDILFIIEDLTGPLLTGDDFIGNIQVLY